MKITHRDGKFSMQTEHGEAELKYRIEGKHMSIYHTFVPEKDRGKKIGAHLTKAAFAFATQHELKVKPDCSYTEHFLKTHKEMRIYAV